MLGTELYTIAKHIKASTGLNNKELSVQCNISKSSLDNIKKIGDVSKIENGLRLHFPEYFIGVGNDPSGRLDIETAESKYLKYIDHLKVAKIEVKNIENLLDELEDLFPALRAHRAS